MRWPPWAANRPGGDRRPVAPGARRRIRADRRGAPRTGGARSASGSAPASPSPSIALLAFKLGTVASLVLCLIVVTFAAGECFGVLRRAGYHPATLLGLVGTISLMVGAYSKGVAAVPLVLVLITAFTLIWYLFGIERGSPGRRHGGDPADRRVGVAPRLLRRPAPLAVDCSPIATASPSSSGRSSPPWPTTSAPW